MQRYRTYLAGLTISLTLVALALFGGAPAQAASFAPPTSLQSAATSANSVRFQWVPGVNNNWYCVDTATSAADLISFKGSWRNHGCGTNQTSLDVANVACGTTYHWRVYAWNYETGGHSYVSTVQTPSCNIGAPTGLRVNRLDEDSVRLSWNPGTHDRWYCVDVARSLHDLKNFGPTWHNYACWTTANSIVLDNVDCGVTYHWLVFAWNEYTNTKSAPSAFTLGNCSAEAPIEDIDVDASSADPPRYTLTIVAGLPNGCTEPDDYNVSRDGRVIEVEVLNRIDSDSHCTQQYGTYELEIDLGTNFQSGRQYTVVVNGEVYRFTTE